MDGKPLSERYFNHPQSSQIDVAGDRIISLIQASYVLLSTYRNFQFELAITTNKKYTDQR